MKPSTSKQKKSSKPPQSQKQKQVKLKHKHSNYLQLSNQQFLRRNLMLLGVTQSIFLKQTKSSLQAQFFTKNITNPTSSKQFFYITYYCLEQLTSHDQINQVKIWYPPRTLNQQLEYKKAFFKVIQNLQLLGRLPKNIIISKTTLMGDTSSNTILQFLRFFSQIALRHQYLERFSKKQRLIQVCCHHESSNVPNNINKFYLYPFVPSITTTAIDHSTINLPLLKQVYHNYLKIYFRKLSKLRTTTINPILSQMYQQLMKTYLQQTQLSETLTTKIPNALLTQNRSFDRRRIIDKNQQIWKQLHRLQFNYIEHHKIPVLKLQGQIDQILQKWQPIKGISNIIEANNYMKQVQRLKSQLNDHIKQFKSLAKSISQKIAN